MILETKSAFRYGWVVTDAAYTLDVDEGAGEINLEIPVGSYVPSTLVTTIAQVMNEGLSGEYEVTFDRATRIFTITRTDVGTFDLLFSSGSTAPISVRTVIGFDATDLTGASTYQGQNITGTEFTPQAALQRYTPFVHWKEANFASVNETASGIVEVVKFGERQFMECEIKWIYDKAGLCKGEEFLDPDLNAVDNVLDFLDYCITKGELEFLPDRNDPNVFDIMILEKTPTSGKGVGYKLRQMAGLKNWEETGRLTFRKIT